MSNPLIAPHERDLADLFRWEAENSFPGTTPLYETLAWRIADDPALLALAAHAQPHQPAVVLFFGAVHYLLLHHQDEPLARFYPDLYPSPAPLPDALYPVFRAFCLKYSRDLTALIATRRVQTNEVGRCALFLPAFAIVSSRLNGEPFALIEVGSSAGLNLNWDRYTYHYSHGTSPSGDSAGWTFGDPSSPVHLNCAWRASTAPPIAPGALPRVASRVGLDLNPNDVHDESAMLWLRALVWPEQADRAARLERAIALARANPPRVVAGDALALVPALLAELPRAAPVVVLHSFVLNQLHADARSQFYNMLGRESVERALFDVAVEPEDWPAPLVLTSWRDGVPDPQTLAVCDFHGRWMEWRL